MDKKSMRNILGFVVVVIISGWHRHSCGLNPH